MSLAESHAGDGRVRDGSPGRGRPRSEAVERSIVEGVLKLLEEGVPLSELSIERVARTAGVGKATIYRRWSGKEALFVDVLRAAEPPDPVLPGTSMRDDLVVVLEAARQRGLLNRPSAILHNVIAQMKSSPTIWNAYHADVVAPAAGPSPTSCAGAGTTANSAPTSTSTSSAIWSSAPCSSAPSCARTPPSPKISRRTSSTRCSKDFVLLRAESQ